MAIETIDRIIDEHHGEASSLIQVLLEIQRENHWLPKEALERVAEKLQVPLSRILHIATFYKAFSLVPKGRHEVHVCVGTACHIRGATRILDTLKDLTGIVPGETDRDLKFSLETVNCPRVLRARTGDGRRRQDPRQAVSYGSDESDEAL